MISPYCINWSQAICNISNGGTIESTFSCYPQAKRYHHGASDPIKNLTDSRPLQPDLELFDHQGEQTLPDHGDDKVQTGKKE